MIPAAPPASGSIQNAGDVARYRFRANSGQTVTVKANGPTLTALLHSSNKPPGGAEIANILSAAESQGDQASSVLNAVLPAKKSDLGNYYVEVRHRLPLKGTGDFKISVSLQ